MQHSSEAHIETTGEPAIARTVALPFGYSAKFAWTPPYVITVTWAPEVPNIQSPRHLRRFLVAYDAARDAFLADVATAINGRVAVFDSEGNAACFDPKTRH